MSLVSLYDAASLWMTPSGAEDGKLFSQLPTDGSGDFTFSRGSNLAATRVGADGLIEKGRENLLLYSEQFDNPYYIKSLGTITSNQTTAPDGSLTADLFTKTTSVNTVSGLRPSSAPYSSTGIFTFSVYVKQNVGNDVLLRLDAAGNTANASFQFATKSIAATGSNAIDATATELSNGWFRLSITGNITNASWSLSVVNLFPNPANDSVFVWGAQLEIGLAASPYIPTTTTTAQAGVLENTPRLNYTTGVANPSLLLEPSRTNLIGYSEYLLDGWVDTGCTITKTSETNPSGNDISYFATAIDNANGDRIRYFDGTKTGDYYFSFFAKGDGNAHQIYLRALGGSGASNMYWDVAADGTISFNSNDSDANGSPITENFGDGWYRIGFKQTFTGANAYADIRPSSGDINSGIYIWGVQWEAGSYPTSYIPNHSGGSVTRGAESLSKYDFTDSTSKTLFIECGDTRYAGGGGEIILEKTNPVAAIFRIYIETDSSGTNVSSIRLRTEFPVNNYDFNLGNKDEFKKIALSINGSNVKIFGNGSLLGTYVVTPTTMEQLNWRVQSSKYNTKQLLVFPEALSDADCITLTTL